MSKFDYTLGESQPFCSNQAIAISRLLPKAGASHRATNVFVAARIHQFIIPFVLAVACSFEARATVGQPGTLDPFWATGSPLGPAKVITPVGNGSDAAAAMLVQPDGKVLLAGTCAGISSYDFCAIRYDSSGVADASFGSGGKVITPIGSLNDFATSMALQPDGKVVVAGFCQSAPTYDDFCVLRYHSNGTLDTAFNGNGKVVTPMGALPRVGIASDDASAVAVQPDGKIVLAGSCNFSASNTQFCAVRYNSNGTLDTSFGGTGTGKVFTTVGVGGVDTATAMTLQPDGKILIAGYCSGTPAPTLFCAARYNPDGTLDLSFNVTGKVTNAVGSGLAQANAIALQPDGKVLLAGYCFYPASSFDFCAVRFLTSGVLDTNFGSGGRVTTSFGPFNDRATAIALQPDGKLLIAGDCNGTSDNLNNFFCSARYNANGTLDTDYGTTGKVVTNLVGHDLATSIALLPDGRLLQAGSCSTSTLDFCAVRYDGGPFGYQNCKLDIDGDGRVLATTDMLIGTRISLGMTGNAVISGITFPATAARNTWPLIRDYLVTQCGMLLVQ